MEDIRLHSNAQMTAYKGSQQYCTEIELSGIHRRTIFELGRISVNVNR